MCLPYQLFQGVTLHTLANLPSSHICEFKCLGTPGARFLVIA